MDIWVRHQNNSQHCGTRALTHPDQGTPFEASKPSCVRFDVGDGVQNAGHFGFARPSRRLGKVVQHETKYVPYLIFPIMTLHLMQLSLVPEEQRTACFDYMTYARFRELRRRWGVCRDSHIRTDCSPTSPPVLISISVDCLRRRSYG